MNIFTMATLEERINKYARQWSLRPKLQKAYRAGAALMLNEALERDREIKRLHDAISQLRESYSREMIEAEVLDRDMEISRLRRIINQRCPAQDQEIKQLHERLGRALKVNNDILSRPPYTKFSDAFVLDVRNSYTKFSEEENIRQRTTNFGGRGGGKTMQAIVDHAVNSMRRFDIVTGIGKTGTPPPMPKSAINNNQRFPGNNIDATAWIAEGVQIGKGNRIGPFCIIGAPPEYRGKDSVKGWVIIGNNNIITGHVTIDSGADLDGKETPINKHRIEGNSTIIGNSCYIMKGAHIGHNTVIADDVTISCHALIGGNCLIDKKANVGLGAIIHQNKFIAEGTMIGMGAVITKGLGILPYRTYAGNPAKLLGPNNKHPNYTAYMKDNPNP